MKISVARLTQFCCEALQKTGLNEHDARTSAEALVLTDTWGVHTHGVKNLRGYIRRLKGGGLQPEARPRILTQGPAWALVDGDNSIGMVAATFSMETAIAKAGEAGIGYSGLKGSCHFGAAGIYSLLAAETGMMGISMSNDTPTVAAPGSRGAVLGSNPLSFAIPVPGANPILLDIATSAVAGGKVFQAAARGSAIPTGWIIDQEGQPTTNPSLFPEKATLTPFAGHKGYGMAILIEVLSAVVTGAAVASGVPSWSFSSPSIHTNHGGAFVAIDIRKFLDWHSYTERITGLVAEIRAAPRAPGVERIYLPGEMEWKNREKALVEGLDLPPEVTDSLRMLSRESGLALAEA